GTYYQQADANLGRALPKVWLGAALKMLDSTKTLLEHDAVDAFATLDDDSLKRDLDACLVELDGEVGKLGDALAARMPDATDDCRLGGTTLLAMLDADEGIDTDLDSLRNAAQADLDANHAAILDAAHAIDPSKSPEDVIAEVTDDKPDLDKL